MKRSLYFAVSFVLALAIGVSAGCAGNRATPSQVPVVPTESPVPVPKTQVLLYFNRGEYVGVAGREIPTDTDLGTRIESTLDELCNGPSEQDLQYGLTGTAIPSGTEVNGVTVDGDLATVDLSESFQSGGGSLSMLLRVAQVVFTVTQFKDVERVAFELDGVPAQAIGGEGVVVSPPVTRADFEGQTPPILVERPVPGQQVKSPIKVSGSSNVFEGQSNVDVKDPDGVIVSQQIITATSGMGTRGTFEASIPYETPRTGQGSVIFFDISPKDGSTIDLVEIPVVLK